MFGWRESRGVRKERFFGVVKMVMVRFLRESWWVRSRSGRRWPCAGYGKTRMCGLPSPDMVRF